MLVGLDHCEFEGVDSAGVKRSATPKQDPHCIPIITVFCFFFQLKLFFFISQVAYFCLFSGAMTWTFCVSKALPFVAQFCRRHYIFVGLSVAVLSVIINAYTVAHPYLLADNRHYTFYIWRRIITVTEWSKYVLVIE